MHADAGDGGPDLAGAPHGERVQPPSEEGRDDTLARFYRFIEEARRRDDVTLDGDFCRRVGEAIEPFPGVPGMAPSVFGDRPEDGDALEKVDQNRRVQNLAKADCAGDAELMESLRLAVESTCKLIALRRLGKGGQRRNRRYSPQRTRSPRTSRWMNGPRCGAGP